MKSRASALVWLSAAIGIAGAVRDVDAYRTIWSGRLAAADVRPIPRLQVTDTTLDAILSVVDNDIFSANRAFTAEVVAQPPAAVSRSAESLELRGIVGGPPWTAIVQGLPNRTGDVLLHPHDTVADIRVLGVSRDAVHIRQGDSTRVLRLRPRF